MRIAGVDPSLTNTGLVLIDNGQLDAAHSIGWGKGMSLGTWLQRNQRGRELASSVMQWVVDSRPDCVAIESPIPHGMQRASTPDQWWLFGLILAECDIRGLPTVCVNPVTRQCWPAGKRWDKKQILAWVRDECYRPVVVHGRQRQRVLNADIADAVVLALLTGVRAGEPMPFRLQDRHVHSISDVDWPELIRALPEPGLPEQGELFDLDPPF